MLLLQALLLSSVVHKFILRPLETGRILRRSDEFMGFQMQMFLAAAVALGSELVQAADFMDLGLPLNWAQLLTAVPLAFCLRFSFCIFVI